jgi:serpin B
VNYGAGVHALDFATAPDASRVTINDWVEERTRDRIQDLLPPNSISSSTVAVLTNALYLKAPWAAPFDEGMTRDATFTLLDGAEISVPTMYEVEGHGYTEGPGYQALEMTYRTDELSMVFLLPDAGTFADFEAGLDADTLAGILDDLETRSVEVALPKFEFESTFTLKETLEAMGMVIPFTGSADLSGMVEGGGLFIDNAYHKTFIAVDEEGTEAAAATAVVVVETSAPAGEVEFHADRPFLFLIRDRVTGALLFFGRMVDPS